MHGIRGILGNEAFWGAIRHCVQENKGKIVETSDFRKAIESISGLDFERHFEEWLEKPGYPIYEASYSWLDEEKRAPLKIKQTNAHSNDVPLFSNPIEIRFSYADSSITNKIRMDEPSKIFEFILPSEPLNVSIDPSNWILKDLNFEKPMKMFLYQISNDKNLIERIRACEVAKSREDEAI